MSNLTTETTAKIFLTDYTSYNNGTQFEFGHWVDLSDFSDESELSEYIGNHFAEADKVSPLDSPREETMITDFEGFPKSLYSESSMSFARLYEYLNLESDDKIKVAFILEQGESIEYALSSFENVCLSEDTDDAKYDLFEMYYPNVLELESSNDYLSVDYDRFIKENYTPFEFEGEYYLVKDDWNQ